MADKSDMTDLSHPMQRLVELHNGLVSIINHAEALFKTEKLSYFTCFSLANTCLQSYLLLQKAEQEYKQSRDSNRVVVVEVEGGNIIKGGFKLLDFFIIFLAFVPFKAFFVNGRVTPEMKQNAQKALIDWEDVKDSTTTHRHSKSTWRSVSSLINYVTTQVGYDYHPQLESYLSSFPLSAIQSKLAELHRSEQNLIVQNGIYSESYIREKVPDILNTIKGAVPVEDRPFLEDVLSYVDGLGPISPIATFIQIIQKLQKVGLYPPELTTAPGFDKWSENIAVVDNLAIMGLYLLDQIGELPEFKAYSKDRNVRSKLKIHAIMEGNSVIERGVAEGVIHKYEQLKQNPLVLLSLTLGGDAAALKKITGGKLEILYKIVTYSSLALRKVADFDRVWHEGNHDEAVPELVDFAIAGLNKDFEGAVSSGLNIAFDESPEHKEIVTKIIQELQSYLTQEALFKQDVEFTIQHKVFSLSSAVSFMEAASKLNEQNSAKATELANLIYRVIIDQLHTNTLRPSSCENPTKYGIRGAPSITGQLGIFAAGIVNVLTESIKSANADSFIEVGKQAIAGADIAGNFVAEDLDSKAKTLTKVLPNIEWFITHFPERLIHAGINLRDFVDKMTGKTELDKQVVPYDYPVLKYSPDEIRTAALGDTTTKPFAESRYDGYRDYLKSKQPSTSTAVNPYFKNDEERRQYGLSTIIPASLKPNLKTATTEERFGIKPEEEDQQGVFKRVYSNIAKLPGNVKSVGAKVGETVGNTYNTITDSVKGVSNRYTESTREAQKPITDLEREIQDLEDKKKEIERDIANHNNDISESFGRGSSLSENDWKNAELAILKESLAKVKRELASKTKEHDKLTYNYYGGKTRKKSKKSKKSKYSKKSKKTKKQRTRKNRK
jgi:hypothetical protein